MPQDLVERAQRGDPEAFRALVRGAADRLYAIAWRILRDPDRAEDALQQALIRVWEDLPSLRDPDRFEAWTYRLIARACYREVQRDRRWSSGIREITFERPDRDPMERVAERDEMTRSFGHLSPEHRAVLILHYYAGLPVSEVAATLGIPVGTAGSRLHYAVRSLRAALEADARGIVALGRPA